MENKLINLQLFMDYIKSKYNNSDFSELPPTVELQDVNDSLIAILVKQGNDKTHVPLICFHDNGTIFLTENIYKYQYNSIRFSDFKTFVQEYEKLY